MNSAKSQSFKIVQINLNFCKAATLQLLKFAEDHGANLVLWQDMHRRGDGFPGLPAALTNLVSIDKTSGILKTNLNLDIFQIAIFKNSVFAGVGTDEGTLTVGSQYSKPSGSLDDDT